jgi:site-specific DNA-methyltransferase (adenine-specific)
MTTMHNGRGDAQKSAKFSEQQAVPDMKIESHGFCSVCNAWKGELGLEPTFELYIKHLIQIFNEVKRVLKKTGSCWVVMGDTYSTKPTGIFNGGSITKNNPNGFYRKTKASGFMMYSNQDTTKTGIPEKSLCMIPSRFAIAMIDNSWILRNDLIWHKPNCMPSSAKDRFTIDYDHVFFFTKSQRYYFETQYEPHSRDWTNDIPHWKNGTAKYHFKKCHFPNDPNPKGRIKRSVWKIPTAPYAEAHFAVYPEKLIETPIKASCPVNGVVLDPFAGSGTTGLVALKNARNFIGIELNADYIELAQKRLKPYLNQRLLI